MYLINMTFYGEHKNLGMKVVPNCGKMDECLICKLCSEAKLCRMKLGCVVILKKV